MTANALRGEIHHFLPRLTGSTGQPSNGCIHRNLRDGHRHSWHQIYPRKQQTLYLLFLVYCHCEKQKKNDITV